MKSMSWGDMPTFEEFKEAFNRECAGGSYEIVAGAGVDSVMLRASGSYTAERLFELVDTMREDWEGEEDGDSPARLAGDIMSTLGFEWI